MVAEKRTEDDIRLRKVASPLAVAKMCSIQGRFVHEKTKG